LPAGTKIKKREAGRKKERDPDSYPTRKGERERSTTGADSQKGEQERIGVRLEKKRKKKK